MGVFDEAFCKSYPNLMRWFSTCSSQPEVSKVLGNITLGGGKGKGAPKEAVPKKEAASKKEAAPKKEEKKAAPKKEEKKKEEKKEAAPAAAGGPVDQAAVDACGNEIRLLKEKLKGEGLSGKKVNEHPEIKALVEKLSKLKAGEAVAGGGAPAVSAADKAAEDRKKQLKKVIKEGGKRGVEIEGAADMGGLQYFCTSMDEPSGDLEFLGPQ